MSPALNVLKARWQAHLACHPVAALALHQDGPRAYPDESKMQLLVRVQDEHGQLPGGDSNTNLNE